MSTAVKLIPVAHATKRTTCVRLDDDGRFTTRVENPIGTITDKSFNFSSLAEGQSFTTANEPMRAVYAEKVGTDARYILEIENFYDSAATGDAIPVEQFVWYDYKTKAEDAPAAYATQTFPLYVLWTSGGTPQSPTTAINATAQTIPNLFTRLGSLAARREYLKGLILKNLDAPNLLMWLAGNTTATLTITSTKVHDDSWGGSTPDVWSTTENQVMARRAQAFTFWLEMLTRAVSVDANLNTATKFNLIAAEAGRSGGDIIGKTRLQLGDTISNRTGDSQPGTNRSLWRFVSLDPGNTWTETIESTISVNTGVAAAAGADWVTYLRS